MKGCKYLEQQLSIQTCRDGDYEELLAVVAMLLLAGQRHTTTHH